MSTSIIRPISLAENSPSLSTPWLRRLAMPLTIVTLVTLAACSSTKLNEAKIEDRSRTGQKPGDSNDPNNPNSNPAGQNQIPGVAIPGTKDALDEPGGVLAKRSVYFDFDSFTIREEFRPLVEAHAKYLVTNKNRRILIQGNTDERGSREYNLALGQKRAEAVRRALALLGVAETQIEAVSLGEEKPRATGNDEAAWAENRRADIVYQ